MSCIVSCRIVSCRRIVSYRVVSCRIISYRVVSYRVVSCRIVSYCIVSCRVGIVSCACVCVLGRKLYWTSTDLRGIYVAEMNGSFTTAIVKDTSSHCRGIAVHPTAGQVYPRRSRIITSGHSCWAQGRIAAAHESFSCFRRVALMCIPSSTWLLGPTVVCPNWRPDRCSRFAGLSVTERH